MTLSPRRLAILGATGSIGTQALEVVRRLRAQGEPFQVVALAAGRRVEALAALVREFRPALVAVAGEEEAGRIRPLWSSCGAGRASPKRRPIPRRTWC